MDNITRLFSFLPIADTLAEFAKHVFDKFDKQDKKVDECLERIAALEATIHQLTTTPPVPLPTPVVTEDDSWDKLDDKGRTKLMNAVMENKIDIIKNLCRLGANVNVEDGYDRTALFYINATSDASDRYAIIHTLKEYGADLDHADRRGMSALAYYTCHGSAYQDVVKILLDAGACPHGMDILNHGVFYHAHQAKNVEIMKLLLDRGVTYFG